MWKKHSCGIVFRLYQNISLFLSSGVNEVDEQVGEGVNSLGPSDAYMRQKTNHHWFREWLAAWSAPSHYLDQCWNIVKSNLRNKLQWNRKRNSHIFIQENALENVVCEMAVLLSRRQCVNLQILRQEITARLSSEMLSDRGLEVLTRKAESELASSQRETSLQSNAVSHWLGANLESTLRRLFLEIVSFSWQ